MEPIAVLQLAEFWSIYGPFWDDSFPHILAILSLETLRQVLNWRWIIQSSTPNLLIILMGDIWHNSQPEKQSGILYYYFLILFFNCLHFSLFISWRWMLLWKNQVSSRISIQTPKHKVCLSPWSSLSHCSDNYDYMQWAFLFRKLISFSYFVCILAWSLQMDGLPPTKRSAYLWVIVRTSVLPLLVHQSKFFNVRFSSFSVHPETWNPMWSISRWFIVFAVWYNFRIFFSCKMFLQIHLSLKDNSLHICLFTFFPFVNAAYLRASCPSWWVPQYPFFILILL